MISSTSKRGRPKSAAPRSRIPRGLALRTGREVMETALEPPARQTLRACLRFAVMALGASVFRLPPDIAKSKAGRGPVALADEVFRELDGEIEHAAIVDLMACLSTALAPLDRSGVGVSELFVRANPFASLTLKLPLFSEWKGHKPKLSPFPGESLTRDETVSGDEKARLIGAALGDSVVPIC